MGTQLTGSCESSTELRLIEPTGIEPTGIEPTPIEPTGIEPTGIEPTGIEPTGIEPTGIEPTGIEPTGIEPTESSPPGSSRRARRGAWRPREGLHLVARQRAQRRERLQTDGTRRLVAPDRDVGVLGRREADVVDLLVVGGVVREDEAPDVAGGTADAPERLDVVARDAVEISVPSRAHARVVRAGRVEVDTSSPPPFPM